MNLLIFTQVIDKNHGELSFFLTWINEFAKHYEKVIVICLEKREFDLAENVRVLSLGKETQASRIKYLYRFYKYIFSLRKDYDHVFVHMNPVYVILGGVFWKIMGKKIGLWFAHGSTPLQLRIAGKLVDNIFTSTKEGCRIKSDKIRIVGQGIDVEKFQAPNSKLQINSKHQIPNLKLKLLTIGRISPAKDLKTLIKAVEILVREGMDLEVKIVGGVALKEHEEYLEKLKRTVNEKGLENIISFVGKVPFEKVGKYLVDADLLVSTSHTGSLDKVILEAVTAGVLVLTCNEAAFAVLGNFKDDFAFRKKDYEELAGKIKKICDMEVEKRNKISNQLGEKIKKEHSLESLINKIMEYYK